MDFVCAEGATLNGTEAIVLSECQAPRTYIVDEIVSSEDEELVGDEELLEDEDKNSDLQQLQQILARSEHIEDLIALAVLSQP